MKNIAIICVFCISHMLLGQDWHASFESALSQAQEQNKPIILVFSGSDWCAPCIKMDREIWSSEQFKTYSKEHYVLYRADFPKKSKNQLSTSLEKENKALADKYNPEGYFPLVVVLDQNENQLGHTLFKKLRPGEYIKLLNSFLE